jgi:hypothetical protein
MIEWVLGLGVILAPAPSQKYCAGDTWQISGVIVQDTAEAFLEHVAECGVPEWIAIRSGGGDPDAAIRIGEVVAEQGIRVEVRGLCASACAMFIALPARELLLHDDDVIGFHHSASANRYMFQRALPDADFDWELLSRLAEEEEAFFEKHGLDRRWLFYPLEKIETQCVYVRRGKVRNSPGYRSTYEMWAPSHDAFGNAVRDTNLLTGNFGLKRRVSVVYGGSVEDARPLLRTYWPC